MAQSGLAWGPISGGSNPILSGSSITINRPGGSTVTTTSGQKVPLFSTNAGFTRVDTTTKNADASRDQGDAPLRTVLEKSQPLAALTVDYATTGRKLEAISEMYVNEFNDAGSVKNPGEYGILNRYAAGSGIFRLVPSQSGPARLVDFLVRQPESDRPVANVDADYLTAENDRNSTWGVVHDLAGAGGRDQGFAYNLTPVNNATRTDLFIGDRPLTKLTSYEYHFRNNIKQKTSASAEDMYDSIKSIELYLPINGLTQDQLVSDWNKWEWNWHSGYGPVSHTQYRHQPSAYILSGLEISVADAATVALKETENSFEAIPYKYDPKTQKPRTYTWDMKNSRYVLDYWNQTIYYGHTIDMTSNEFVPANAAAISEIDNPYYTPNTKIIDAFDKTGSKLVKLIPWKNNLIGFTESSTSLYTGRIIESQQLIHSDIGITEKYRDTVQVVSDSVVFKNKESVFAYVPTPGTDGATSLRVRDIGTQIKEYIKQVEQSEEFEVTSQIIHNGQYWLIYKLSNSTVIFKYDWNNFAWLIDEYQSRLTDFAKLDNDILVARIDGTAKIMELLSNNNDSFMEHSIESIKGMKDFAESFVNDYHGLTQPESVSDVYYFDASTVVKNGSVIFTYSGKQDDRIVHFDIQSQSVYIVTEIPSDGIAPNTILNIKSLITGEIKQFDFSAYRKPNDRLIQPVYGYTSGILVKGDQLGNVYIAKGDHALRSTQTSTTDNGHLHIHGNPEVAGNLLVLKINTSGAVTVLHDYEFSVDSFAKLHPLKQHSSEPELYYSSISYSPNLLEVNATGGYVVHFDLNATYTGVPANDIPEYWASSIDNIASKVSDSTLRVILTNAGDVYSTDTYARHIYKNNTIVTELPKVPSWVNIVFNESLFYNEFTKSLCYVSNQDNRDGGKSSIYSPSGKIFEMSKLPDSLGNAGPHMFAVAIDKANNFYYLDSVTTSIYKGATKLLKFADGYHPSGKFLFQHYDLVSEALSDYNDAKAVLEIINNGTDLKLTTGTTQDLPGTYMDVNYPPKLTWDSIRNNIYNKKLFDPVFDEIFGIQLLPIQYRFELGARRPALDTNIITDDVTVLLGNNSQLPIKEQKVSVLTDGFELHSFDVDIDANATAISAASPQQHWDFGASRYERPIPTKHTKKIRKSVTTLDIHVYGETSNKLFLDGIQFRYRQSGRKSR